MTDSSESLGDYCSPRFVANQRLAREQMTAFYPAPGRLVEVMPTDRVYPMAAPSAHADPRHPWHHVWLAEQERGGKLMAEEAEKMRWLLERQRPARSYGRLVSGIVWPQTKRRSIFGDIFGGLI